MANHPLEAIQDLISRRDWAAALPMLIALLEEQPSLAHAWYLLGQCQRFSGDIPASIHSLQRAIQQDPSEQSYFLALGIAYQLTERYEESLATFRQAHAINPHYVEAYNSAALTLKRMGNMEKSAEIYDAAADALILEIIDKRPNGPTAKIYGFRPTQGHLWTSYLSKAMMLKCAQDDIASMKWPTGEAAQLEYETRASGGLLWRDVASEDGQVARILMPNLFDCVRESLIFDRRYSMILGNKSLVLNAMGSSKDADLHEREALEFESLADAAR